MPKSKIIGSASLMHNPKTKLVDHCYRWIPRRPNLLAFSVTLFCTEACVVIVVLMIRRTKSIGGELGGPFAPKIVTSVFLFSLWIFYLVMSTLEAYGVIQGF